MKVLVAPWVEKPLGVSSDLEVPVNFKNGELWRFSIDQRGWILWRECPTQNRRQYVSSQKLASLPIAICAWEPTSYQHPPHWSSTLIAISFQDAKLTICTIDQTLACPETLEVFDFLQSSPSIRAHYLGCCAFNSLMADPVEGRIKTKEPIKYVSLPDQEGVLLVEVLPGQIVSIMLDYDDETHSTPRNAVLTRSVFVASLVEDGRDALVKPKPVVNKESSMLGSTSSARSLSASDASEDEEEGSVSAEMEEMLTTCECQATHSTPVDIPVCYGLCWERVAVETTSYHLSFSSVQFLDLLKLTPPSSQGGNPSTTATASSTQLFYPQFLVADWGVEIEAGLLTFYILMRPSSFSFLASGNEPSKLFQIRVSVAKRTWPSVCYLSAYVQRLPPLSHTLVVLEEFLFRVLIIADSCLAFLSPSEEGLKDSVIVFHPDARLDDPKGRSLTSLLLSERVDPVTLSGTKSGRHILCYPCQEALIFNRDFLRLTPITFLLEIESSRGFHMPLMLQLKRHENQDHIDLVCELVKDASLFDIRDFKSDVQFQFGNMSLNSKLIDSEMVPAEIGFDQSTSPCYDDTPLSPISKQSMISDTSTGLEFLDVLDIETNDTHIIKSKGEAIKLPDECSSIAERSFDFTLNNSLDSLWILKQKTDPLNLTTRILLEKSSKCLTAEFQMLVSFRSTSSLCCLQAHPTHPTHPTHPEHHLRKLCFSSESMERTPIGRTVLMGMETDGGSDHEYDSTSFPGLDFENYSLLIATHTTETGHTLLLQVTPNEIRLMDYLSGSLMSCYDFSASSLKDPTDISEEDIKLAISAKQSQARIAVLFEDRRLRLYEINQGDIVVEEVPRFLPRFPDAIVSYCFAENTLWFITHFDILDTPSDMSDTPLTSHVQQLFGTGNAFRLLVAYTQRPHVTTHVYPLCVDQLVQRNLTHPDFEFTSVLHDLTRVPSDRSCFTPPLSLRLGPEIQAQLASQSLDVVGVEVCGDAVLLFRDTHTPCLWTQPTPHTLLRHNLDTSKLSPCHTGPIPLFESRCRELQIIKPDSIRLYLIIPPKKATPTHPFVLVEDTVYGFHFHTLDTPFDAVTDIDYFADTPESMFTITAEGQIANCVIERMGYEHGSFLTARDLSAEGCVGCVPQRLAMHEDCVAIVTGQRLTQLDALEEILKTAPECVHGDSRIAESCNEVEMSLKAFECVNSRHYPCTAMKNKLWLFGKEALLSSLDFSAAETVNEVQFLKFGDTHLILAIGTTLNLLGFAAPKGRLWLGEIDPHRAVSLSPHTFTKYTVAGPVMKIGQFKPATEGEERNRHLLFYSGGAKIYLQELSLNNDSVVVTGGSFYECRSTVTDIQPIKSYFLVSTAENGCEFIMFRITSVKTPTHLLPLSLARLACSLCPKGVYLPILSGVSIVHSSQLEFLTSDPLGNVLLMKFQLSHDRDRDGLNETSILHLLDVAKLPIVGAIPKWIPFVVSPKEQIALGLASDGSVWHAKFQDTHIDTNNAHTLTSDTTIYPLGVNGSAARRHRGMVKCLWSDSVPDSLVIG
eukprot:Blabericola_migrator_1__11242@NODE_660_length_7013_cov_22_730636_g482_i0_p1_GENE_NODE_660_length_7013_cov_22_730636_g482_i0NODE_660_length_7013_cov_22_730636_g482_i0_p1_ORF_typecomplete_len1533_score349_58CPSF_A/PF03178_15/93CPSF_A/PF03178_15/6_6e11MMS1_N/PF10433_9/2_7e03MMS1_N/PF10433_9/0_038_NODE_660_length_7013_cov_22_730636_g482_i020586656